MAWLTVSLGSDNANDSDVLAQFQDFLKLRVTSATLKRATIADVKRQIRRCLREGDYESVRYLGEVLNETSEMVTPQDLAIILNTILKRLEENAKTR